MDKLIYIKYSNERARNLSICTEIRQDENGKRYVIKRPYSPEANAHVASIYNWFNKLSAVYQDSKLRMNSCELKEGRVIFEYLVGRTLEEKLDFLLFRGEQELFLELMTQYFSIILNTSSQKPFEMTEEFRQVFGKGIVPIGLKSEAVTNIDMIFGNVMIGNEWHVIDYEWTFEFPIPVNFIVYRAIFFYLAREKMKGALEIDLYQYFNITEEEKECYAQMEDHFGRYVNKGVYSLRVFDTLINNKKSVATEAIAQIERDKLFYQAEIFVDKGEGFLAADSYPIIPKIKEDKLLKLELLIPHEAEKLRMDPFANPCILHIHEMILDEDERKEVKFWHNGKELDENIIFFNTDDPQIIIEDASKQGEWLEITYILEPLEESSAQLMNDYLTEGKESQERLDQLLHSRSLRMTKPFRKIGQKASSNRVLRILVRHLRIAKNQGLRSALSAGKASWRVSKYKRAYPYGGCNVNKLANVHQIYKRKEKNLTGEVKFSILVPLYNTPEVFLREMIESALLQTYNHWELCLCDGSEEAFGVVGEICKEYQSKDKRIRYQKLEKNLGISGNTNACIQMATGTYLVLFDHDDFLHPDALYALKNRIDESQADFLYTDELTFEGDLSNIVFAHYKPHYIYDNLLANNYICHLTCFSRELLDEVEGFRSEYDGSQDYDLILRLVEKAKKVEHIKGAYYYWRAHSGSMAQNIDSKDYAVNAGMRAVQASLDRKGIKGTASLSNLAVAKYRIDYELEGNPLVSVIIHNHNSMGLFSTTIESILEKTTYKNMELLIVDYKSDEADIIEYYKEQESQSRIRVLHWNRPYHYSQMNNMAAEQAKGEYLLFLHHDMEVISADWLQALLMYAQREDVGAVGGKLYFENDAISHAGLKLENKDNKIASICHYKAGREEMGQIGKLGYAQGITAVSGACMMVKKAHYEEVKGFDEEMAFAFGDLDFCLRLSALGYMNIFTPFAELYHFEIGNFGFDSEVYYRNESKMCNELGYQMEKGLMSHKWGEYIHRGDPYYPEPFLIEEHDVTQSLHGQLSNSESLGKRIVGRAFLDKVTQKKMEHLAELEAYSYENWIVENELEEEEILLTYKPKISVFVIARPEEKRHLKECIASIEAQSYQNIEYFIIEEENQSMDRATGEFLAVIPGSDILAKNAFYEMAKKLNESQELDFIYSDEDIISEEGRKRHTPFFKPDWSPDTFMSFMYTNNLGIYRSEIAKKIEGFTLGLGMESRYDFTFRFMELSHNKRVGHVAKILYHVRGDESFKENERIKIIKEETLERRGISGQVLWMEETGTYNVVYDPPGEALVSIVIPSKDNGKVLKQCIDSIKRYTEDVSYEIIVVDNGSLVETKNELEGYALENNVIYCYEEMDFNFSKMCNKGLALAKGDYVLLLNDDVEIVQKDWLSVLLGQASLDYAGTVGAKLYYPDSKNIQHMGVVLFVQGPSHIQQGYCDQRNYYFGRNRFNYNYSSVTAACLMVKKSIYHEVGGFNEGLAVAYNDVDFCFKVFEAGYYNSVRNDVVCFHHESYSRGFDAVNKKQFERLDEERGHMFSMHPIFDGYDPFYNVNLIDNENGFALRRKMKRTNDIHEGSYFRRHKKVKPFLEVNVDRLSVEKQIIIEGWALGDSRFDPLLDKYIVLESDDGTAFRLGTTAVRRVDVVQVKGKFAEYSGFLCKIPVETLQGEEKQFKVGIMGAYHGYRRFSWLPFTLDMKDQVFLEDE